MNLKFDGKVEDNKMILDDRERFQKCLNGFNDKRIQLIIKKYHTTRSLKQNAYYWGVVIPIIAEWVGEDDLESIHEALKGKFLQVRNVKGLKIIQSTAKQNTTEFEIYLGKVKRWASMECGLIIPDPEQVDIE